MPYSRLYVNWGLLTAPGLAPASAVAWTGFDSGVQAVSKQAC